MAAVGNIALVFSMITMLYSIIVGYLGRQQDSWNLRASAQGAASAAFFLIAAAAIVLWHALLTNDFSFLYVANYSKIELPWYYKFSAFWAGQAGSLLFWLLLSAALPPLLLRSKLPANIALRSSSLLTALNFSFLLILFSTTPPFQTLQQVPLDGSGLNPMLQSFGMIVHPPVTFLAFALFSVPWAIVCSSLWTKPADPWHHWIRPWMLAAWTALTFGIVSGGQWAYTELGWGGYWAWDPVENASLFPWLTATAMLHTLSLQRRGFGFGRWNASLACINLLLCVFGTFLTRSGLLDSVHAFSDSRVGQAFLLLLAILALVSLISLWRGSYETGKSPNSLLSFYGVFVLLSSFLLLMTIGVFVGTMMPYFSSFFGRSLVLQEAFYNQFSIPFWLGVVALLGLSAVTHWQDPPRNLRTLSALAAASLLAPLAVRLVGIDHWLALLSIAVLMFAATGVAVDSVKRKAHRPAHLIHIGLLCIVLGITGSLFNEERLQPLEPEQTMRIGRYEFLYPGMEHQTEGMYTRVSTDLSIRQNGAVIGTVQSDKTFHPTYHQPSTNIGVFGSWREDIYFNLSGWEHDTAYLQVSIKPLVAWIWLGSYLMYAGGLWLLWSWRRQQKFSKR